MAYLDYPGLQRYHGKVQGEIDDLKGDLSDVFSDEAKQALLACFEKVAWVDEHGQDYYDALEDALYPNQYPKITAVYTPGTHVVYTDDQLNSLKTYLVVKYYEDDESSGTTISSNDYTLSGALTEGTSTITVHYEELSTSFTVANVVDFYNVMTRSITLENLIKVNAGTDTDQTDTAKYPSRTRMAYPGHNNYYRRRTIAADRGHACIYYTEGGDFTYPAPTDYYPIPIPANANHIKITLLPAGQYVYMHTIPYDPINNYYGDSIVANRQAWTQMDTSTGVFEKTITREDDSQLFLVANFKHNSSGTEYSQSTEPTAISVEFSTVS